MKILWFLSLLFLSMSAFGQYTVTDSVSGGSFTVNGANNLGTIIQDANSIICEKPAKKNIKPVNGDPCANVSKILGYKIQIKYSKSRSVILEEIEKFKKEFRGIEAEMAYSQPDYRLLVGDYFSKRSAALDLARIKRKYPASFLIQWRVYCNKAK